MTASPFTPELLRKDINTRVPPNDNHLPDLKKTDAWHESDNPPSPTAQRILPIS